MKSRAIEKRTLPLKPRGVGAGPKLTAAAVLVLLAAALIRRRRRGIQFFRSITVGAPPDVVYDFWTRFENFAECFRHVKDVHRTGNDNEWRWVIEGPSGERVEWDTWVTESIPGKAVAWESAPGSKIRSAGVVQFTEAGKNSTRVDLRLFYCPSAWKTARTLSAALGARPDELLDEGLSRLQSKFDEDAPSYTEAV